MEFRRFSVERPFHRSGQHRPVDDLHPPGDDQGGQELAAQAFMQRTFFRAGDQRGIMAMKLAAVGPGDKILIPRTHKSVWTAVVLSGPSRCLWSPKSTRSAVSRTASAWPRPSARSRSTDAKAVLVVNHVLRRLRRLAGIAEVVHSPIPCWWTSHGAHLYSSGAPVAMAAERRRPRPLKLAHQSSILNLQGGRPPATGCRLS